MQTYKVVRQHYGDKQYWQGDERQLSDLDAKRLLENGIVEVKKESEHSNKMAQQVKNKAK